MPDTPLHLESDQAADTLRLTLAADTLGPEGARVVTEHVAAVDCRVVRLHLAGVSMMTSAAIGALIVLHKRLAAEQRLLELFDLSPNVREAMEFLKLDRVLTIRSASSKAS